MMRIRDTLYGTLRAGNNLKILGRQLVERRGQRGIPEVFEHVGNLGGRHP